MHAPILMPFGLEGHVMGGIEAEFLRQFDHGAGV